MTRPGDAPMIEFMPTATAAGMPVDATEPPAPADIERVARRLRALMLARETYTEAAAPMVEFLADRLLRLRAGRAVLAESAAPDDALRSDVEMNHKFAWRTLHLLDLAPDDGSDADLARLILDA